MERVFLDANVVFSAAYRPGAALSKLWRLKDVVLCSSRYALEEARRNLETEVQRSRLANLGARLTLLDAPPGQLPSDIILPDKDVHIFLAAIEASATHLLTGDFRHLGRYYRKRIAGILILPPAEYLRQKL
jgi:uncharacterized protein